MYQIHVELTDQLYHEVKRRADQAGFTSVDDYVVEVLTHDDEQIVDTPSLDHLFTPERIAHIKRVSAAVKAGGKTYTMEEVGEHLAQTRADWIREHGK